MGRIARQIFLNRFLIDECLTPDLVAVAKTAGYDATHVTFLGKSGVDDRSLVKLALERDYAIVTNNAGDFRKLYSRIELHPGLVIIIPQLPDASQIAMFRIALAAIEQRPDIVNTLVIVSADGHVSFQPLSSA